MSSSGERLASARAESAARLGALGTLALVAAWGAAQPARAQFVANEGFGADGKAKAAFEADLFVYLPHTKGTVGLGDPPGQNINIDRPRPTVADLASSLDGAFTCNCLVRYGRFSGEFNTMYFSVKQNTTLLPVPPETPEASLTSKMSYFLISPGVGYRLSPTTAADKWAVDLRAGFTYNNLDVSTALSATLPSGPYEGSSKRNFGFVQPWAGWRVDYYPSRRWRIDNTVAITGLGVDGAKVGWNAQINASYLVTKWFDVSLGYQANIVNRDPAIGPDGVNRTVNLVFYGPVFAMGFRF
jgi:hypothetical protein